MCPFNFYWVKDKASVDKILKSNEKKNQTLLYLMYILYEIQAWEFRISFDRTADEVFLSSH